MAVKQNSVPFMLIAKRLKAMADPSRLLILQNLCEGEKNVTELVNETGFSQASVSKHLRVLREEGLVIYRRAQKNIFYHLASDLSREVCNLICRSLESRASSESEILKDYWRIAE